MVAWDGMGTHATNHANPSSSRKTGDRRRDIVYSDASVRAVSLTVVSFGHFSLSAGTMSSPASPSPSLPDTAPVTEDELFGRFATLSPDSTDAEAALHDVVESLGDQLQLSILGAFIESSDLPAPEAPLNSSFQSSRDNGDITGDDCDRGDAHQGPQSGRRKKYRFVLSFDVHPQGPRAGWVLGRGNHHGPGVQLPVCQPPAPKDGTPARPGGAIALIYMHPETGAFVIQALSEKHPVTYRSGDGNTDITLHSGEHSVLHMTRNHLRFRLGSKIFDYVFEFDVADEGRYIAARNHFARGAICRGAGVDPYTQLDLLPKQSHHRIRNVVVHRTLSAGAFGLVKSGVDTETGDAVAIKTIHCKTRQVHIVQNELNIAASFAPVSSPYLALGRRNANHGDWQDAVGIIPILDAWCEHGNSPPCFGSPLEDIHFSMPLARCDFEHAPWQSISDFDRMTLFRQTLQGLDAIHALRIMHRDISPRNLLIDSFQPPRAGICDFGKAKRGIQGTETGIGPIHTVAPEVWAAAGPYSSAIDVWSLAYAWLWTFQRRTDVKYRTDARRQASLVATVENLYQSGDITVDFADLLHSMLAYDAHQRPTAETALQHPAWNEIEAAASSGDTECNTPASASESFGPGPAKKLRLDLELAEKGEADDCDASLPSTLSPPTP